MKQYIITTRDNQTIRVDATAHLNTEVAENGLKAVILHSPEKISAGNVSLIELEGEVFDLRSGEPVPVEALPKQDVRATFANRVAGAIPRGGFVSTYGIGG